jgi:hypothetical protein
MTKTPLQSTTIQGALVLIFSGLFSMLEYDFDEMYFTELTNAILLVFGGIMTIYGRWKATGKISITK